MKLAQDLALLQCLVWLASASNIATLQPWRAAPLPLGSVKPGGWLLGEMKSMASGLAGHEHDFYVYVNESAWLQTPGSGGIEYSNLNEGLPYWFNGLVPLAYSLNDETLKSQVHAVAETVLGHQAQDGWIGPEVGDERNFWARTPFFMGMTQLAEADAAWETKVVTSLRSFMNLTNTMLQDNSKGFTNCARDVDCSWGQARIHDLIITIQWLLEKHPSSQDALLWDNMNMFYSQLQYKWDEWYTAGKYQVIPNLSDGSIIPFVHGVNVGQGKSEANPMQSKSFALTTENPGLKASAVMYRFKKTDYFLQQSRAAIDLTFTHHGSPSGTILADEWEQDLAPYMGSELCTAVETGYSLAYMYQTLGNGSYADRAERTIYNALPVMMTSDHWAHQYMAQPNQPFALSTVPSQGSPPAVFTTANSGVATTFGMEPQYPCCTVNHPQGYPKFLANSWVAVGQSGLGHALLGPSTVSSVVSGGKVTVQCSTGYPFVNSLSYSVDAEKDFQLYLRLPEWADTKSSSIAVNGAQVKAKADPQTGLQMVSIKAGKSQVLYTIGTTLRTESRGNKTVSVFYGNLLYALDVGNKATSSLPHAYYDARGDGIAGLPYDQLRDYYVNSTTAWNVAVDPSTLQYHGIKAEAAGDLRSPIFSYGYPPTYVTVDGCEIDWDLYLNVTPGRAPANRTCVGEKKSFKLIPYGSAKVHMSELPTTKF